MAYAGVTLPLTGAGDATAAPAVDVVSGLAYQAMKLVDGLEGSTEPVRALGTTPASTDHGLVVRPIASSAYAQGVVGEVALTSAGSTREIGRVTLTSTAINVANPTTAVTVTNPSTAVTVSNPTTSVSLSSVHTVTVGNPTTAVTVSSGVVLAAGSSANTLGAVAQGAGSTSIAPWYVISSAGGGGSTTVDANLTSAGSTKTVGVVSQGSPAGSSADAWWVRTVTTGAAGAGSTAVDATLTSGGSTRTVGVIGQGPASSADFWFVQSIPFSSGNIARTSVGTSVDASVIAANANRKALLIANGSTAQMVGLGFSTAAVTTGRANVNVYLQANSQLRLGLMGDLPCYRGPIRGINLTSTAVTGGVIVTEFT